MLPKILWLSGAAIFLILGCIHLYYTFFTTRLDPRNKNLIDEMKNTSPRLSSKTTLWKTWVGFNASHSAGVIFLGLINGIVALRDFSIIENSFLFSFCTIGTSIFYLWLARKYWFSSPFIGILIAVVCFVISPIASFFT